MLHVMTDLAQYSVKHFEHVISDDNCYFVLNFVIHRGYVFKRVHRILMYTLYPHTSSYHSYLKPLTWLEH